jgi:hypothetical protein
MKYDMSIKLVDKAIFSLIFHNRSIIKN